MTLMLDINVLLDVFLVRQPHYPASARILSLIAEGQHHGAFAAHGLTTLYYLARKQSDRKTAEAAVDSVLSLMRIVNLDLAGWRRARALGIPDFEDAVIACSAATIDCDFIITRNVPHFSGSPVAAITPVDFLCMSAP
jgi:predicted nucleic acid-binding protein